MKDVNDTERSALIAGLLQSVLCEGDSAELQSCIPPVLSTCPFHTNSGCGKERRILVGPW